MDNQYYARIFCDAIKKIAVSDFAINNFENYLSQHFDIWLKKYANNPPAIAAEIASFARVADYSGAER